MTGAKSIQIKQIVESIRTEVAQIAWYRYKRKSKNNETSFPSRSNPNFTVPNPVVIDATFTGTPEDLSELDQIDWVTFARLHGPTITRQHLEAVLKLPNLSHLQLVDVPLTTDDLMVIKQGPDIDLLELQYVPIGDENCRTSPKLSYLDRDLDLRTKISQAGLERAESMLGDVVLTYSRGAFLGVQCNSNDVTVTHVEPDSAADNLALLVEIEFALSTAEVFFDSMTYVKNSVNSPMAKKWKSNFYGRAAHQKESCSR